MVNSPLDRLYNWWPAALFGLATLLSNFADSVRILLS